MTANRVNGDPVAEASLVGVWGSEEVVGPRIRGALTIDVQGTEWHAYVGGFDVPVTHQGDDVRFALPEGLGEFRGRVSENAKTILGHWIQPGGGIFSQRYATPVQLFAAGKSAWTGRVQPLEERISFYVSIQPAPDGTLKARIRNPEFGAFSAGTWQVARKENQAVDLIGQYDGYTIKGMYETKTEHLLLTLWEGATPMVLARRTEANAVGLYPRTPHQDPAHYIYRQPIEEKDGWSTASLQSVGIDSQTIATLMKSLLSVNLDEDRFLIHSLLIARHGKLVLEEYFRGFDRERTHDMRSAGKTFAPLLIGVAREQGAKVDANTPVYDLFPQYKPFAHGDERKSKLTLEHLMTMTPGLASDDNDGTSPGGEDKMQSQTEEPDWYRYTLNLPMVRDPGGTTAIYSSASLNLVGGVAERVTGMWNADLFYQRIALPLQFGEYHLNLMPTGSAYMGGGAYLRPRDELKLGQLYLAGGKWNGRRIISRDWAERSTAYRAKFDKPMIDIDSNHQYGYGWHIYHFTVGSHVYRMYAAGGNGGQWVMVIPELDMVVGINGGSYRNANVWYRWGLELLPHYLIPACTHKTKL